MPGEWFWGQAHGFDREDACVAFAGEARGDRPAARPGRRARDQPRGPTLRLVYVTGVLRAVAGDGTWRLRGRTGRDAVLVEGGERQRPAPAAGAAAGRAPAARRRRSASTSPGGSRSASAAATARPSPAPPSWRASSWGAARPSARPAALGRDGQRLGADQPLEDAHHRPDGAQAQPGGAVRRRDARLADDRARARRAPLDPVGEEDAHRTRPVPGREVLGVASRG